MFSSTVFVVLFLHLFVQVLSVSAQPAEGPSSHIIVQGSVFCDVCCDNTFSKHSYFLSGVDIHVQCKFKASSPRTAEQISFSVNRTTDKYGVYKLDIPSVDGVDCIEEPTIQSFCQVNLIQSTSQACNVPGLKSTSNEITIKSKQNRQCIYSLDALSYRPSEKNTTLCPKIEVDLSSSFNSSKFFLPLPQLPPIPTPPNFLFPFSSAPIPSLLSRPPPAFSIEDTRTWIQKNPSYSPSQMPPYNRLDPKTWFPYTPHADTNSQHP